MKVRALQRIANTVDGVKGIGGYRKGQEFLLDDDIARKWIASGMIEEVKPEPETDNAVADEVAAVPKKAAKKAAKKSDKKTTDIGSDND
jgi:hypothetical protein